MRNATFTSRALDKTLMAGARASGTANALTL
jgi:hypothetical protein